MSLPLQRYTFNWVATSDIYLPAYSGSVLRGNFGNILRKTVCFTKYETCVHCPLIERCSYGKLYDTVQLGDNNHTKQTHPYILEPLEYNRRFIKTGEEFSFSMVLLGDTYKDLALYVFVWEKIFSQYGLRVGKQQGFAKLNTITTDNNIIYDNSLPDEELTISEHNSTISIQIPDGEITKINILLQTPLRLQGRDENNRSIIIGCSSFDARAFITGLINKSRKFYHSYAPQYSVPSIDVTAIQITEKKLDWVKTKRYSGAQKREMEFYGIIGSFVLEGKELAKLMPLIELCEYLHLGKSSTFGFGKITLG